MIAAFMFAILLQTDAGSITGKLIDYSSREPIRGARIVLEHTLYKTTTNRNGEFTLSGVRPGTYQLLIIHSYYPSGGSRTVVVAKDSTTSLFLSMIRSPGPEIQHLEADTSHEQ